MAKNITYFDREHTGGINLAAMEDTQLKENLVQDIAAGGEEAPTATAVKEAVDVKMDKADIVNDLTTGGTDKALSAEQGKVLEGKKVDKLTDATDLVYVHGSDGTEQGKALAEFVVDADIINDVTTGGVDKVLSAEQGKVLEEKKVDKVTTPDSVYVTEGSKPLSEFVVDADIVNDRVTGGVDKVLAAEVGKDLLASFELSFTAANYPLTAATIDKSKYTDHVMSISTLYIHPDEIPADIKGKLKKGDLISTVAASPIISCKAVFARVATADESSTNVTSDVVNTSLPAAGNWEGWYAFNVLISEQDKLMIEGKTNTYCTFLFDGDETLDTLPDANGPMPTGGFSFSLVFIKPSDIKANRLTTGIPSPYLKQVDGSDIKPGDFLTIDTPNSAEATKKIRSIQCLITHTAARNTQLGPHVMNTKLPAAGSWEGWLVGRILSSGWDRDALLSKTDSTKMQNYMVTLPTEGETFASMPDINNVGYGKGMSGSNFFVHPDDIAPITGSLKRGDIVIFTGVVSTTGKTFETVTAIYTGAIATGTEVLGEADLNETPPASGNYKGWYIFYTLSTVYDRRIVQKKVNHWTISVKSTDQQFKDTWTASKTGAIEDVACPLMNFMLTKAMMAQIPDAKAGDLLYIYASDTETGLNRHYDIYGVLQSREVSISPNYYQLQDNTGDVSGCGSMRVISSNMLSQIVRRKPNFWPMTTTAGNSNIPIGLESIAQIAFAPGADTAAFADALKRGDLIEIASSTGIMYIAEFTRYAITADNTNGNKSLVVGQATPPADITGYLFCNIIASTYDSQKSAFVETSRYQPDQFEVGKLYSIDIRPSDPTDYLVINKLAIRNNNIDEYNCVARRGFGEGTVFRLRTNSTNIIMQVANNTYSNDGRVTAICLSKGADQVVRL